MKHYATYVDLFEILNGEFRKEMVGGGGGPLWTMFKALRAREIRYLVGQCYPVCDSTLPAYLMCDLVFICMFSYVRMKTLKLNVAYLNICLKFVTTVLTF